MKYDREMKIICKLSSTEKNDFHSSVGILTDNLSSAFFFNFSSSSTSPFLYSSKKI